MKLVVQIPAYNEEATIQDAIRDVQAWKPGACILVVSDGSTDKTMEKVNAIGLKGVISYKHHGLGFIYRVALEHSLDWKNADIIVNYDADMQYKAIEIDKLIQPILRGEADVVIGNRQVHAIDGYPQWKVFTQTFWNKLLTWIFGIPILDATSGFRAINKDSAELLVKHLKDDYTYSAESLFVLNRFNKRIKYVPITIRPSKRPSRLITNKVYYTLRLFRIMFKYLFIMVSDVLLIVRVGKRG